MDFTTKIAIVVAQDLEVWQKLNVVSFLTSGIISEADNVIGKEYNDASGNTYSPLCIQPVVVLSSSREKLTTFLKRSKNRGVRTSIYIEDMFLTGYDEANRMTVSQYDIDSLPLVGMGIRTEKKQVDKIFKGAKLHK